MVYIFAAICKKKNLLSTMFLLLQLLLVQEWKVVRVLWQVSARLAAAVVVVPAVESSSPSPTVVCVLLSYCVLVSLP